ncbi:MmyB family transcriptional regulator [Cellulomonas soli]|uniref:MmyB family transcriptional regulator n=1 Tax=Cellulomonas soli TaxID=931535 RepID=UPI0015CDF2EF
MSTRPGADPRTRWGDHRVRTHNDGLKHLNHPVVGPMTFAAPIAPGISISTYLTDPGTPSLTPSTCCATGSRTPCRTPTTARLHRLHRRRNTTD